MKSFQMLSADLYLIKIALWNPVWVSTVGRTRFLFSHIRSIDTSLFNIISSHCMDALSLNGRTECSEHCSTFFGHFFVVFVLFFSHIFFG